MAILSAISSCLAQIYSRPGDVHQSTLYAGVGKAPSRPSALHIFPYDLKETWVDWTYRTLDLIQGMGKLLSNMRRRGKLVKSFKPSRFVPLEVIDVFVPFPPWKRCTLTTATFQDTNVVAVLDEIAAAEWGPDTDDIRESAIRVRDDLLEPYVSNEEGDH
jgi:hypothetical protein